MKLSYPKPLLYSLRPAELSEALEAAQFPKFRAQQVFEGLYKQRIQKWEELSTIPAKLRLWLEERYILNPLMPVLVKGNDDVTQKHLLQLGDKALIETVFIRYPQRGVGQEESRTTICVSSQVGCAYGCKFCASGLDGFKRNLEAGEIIAQVMRICHVYGEKGGPLPFDNIVFMGMGEPLANYENVLKAIEILNAPWGLHFGARRITLSTSGLVPQIHKLAEEPVSFRLAISLHGATDAVREQIMPINKKYPLEQLIPAVKAFSEAKGRMVTLEYILIENVNDGLDQAGTLVGIAKDLHAHVNLIPYNSVQGLPWKRPSIMRQRKFYDTLSRAGVSVTIRKEKGHEIAAACGQLRLQHLKSSE